MLSMNDFTMRTELMKEVARLSDLCEQLHLSDVPEWIQPTMLVGCDTKADQGDFECRIKNRAPFPCLAC